MDLSTVVALFSGKARLSRHINTPLKFTQIFFFQAIFSEGSLPELDKLVGTLAYGSCSHSTSH